MAGNRKLGKTTDIRLAMLKTQVTDLILHGKIETTENETCCSSATNSQDGRVYSLDGEVFPLPPDPGTS